MNPAIFLKNESLPITILLGPFSGAKLFMNPQHSKRHIFGIYESCLNPWLKTVIPQVSAVFDVGANHGYFTYGCAQVMRKHQKNINIIAFDPGLTDNLSKLTIPSGWPQYRGVNFEFIPLLVGSQIDEKTTTLDRTLQERPLLGNRTALIKVDVEGAELEVLAGAGSLLNAPHYWVVEVHGDHLLDPVLSFFRAAQRNTEILELQPHWLLGPEKRTIKTSWVVTKPN